MSHSASRVLLRVCVAAARLFPIVFFLVGVLETRPAYAQALPSGWSASNIGGATPVGRAVHANDTFTVEGGGKRIYSTSDQFYFVHRRMTGDGTIQARIGSVEGVDPWTKAGVMIRESLDSRSRHAMALVTPGEGVAFHRRASTGGTTTHTGVAGTAPSWLRLTRSGSTIIASWSSAGTLWMEIGRATVSMASTVYIGLAVSSYNASQLATATFTNVGVPGGAAPAQGLPSPWVASDIGAPAIAGRTTWNGTQFEQSSAGYDIWGARDEFQFAYQQVSGDVDIVARVASFAGPYRSSRTGVMVRASLAADAANAMAFVTLQRGVGFQNRPAAGHQTVLAMGPMISAPTWLKLERRGSAVTAFHSANGTSWSMMGSATLPLGSSFYVGMATTSRDASASATARLENVTVSGSSGTPTSPPTVSLTSPAAGATFTAPANVSLAANASDADNGVAQVEFYANGTLLGTDPSNTYTFAWSNVPAGDYSITAVARDNGGLVTTSAVRTISVTSGGTTNTPPSVSLTAPAAGSVYVSPASMTISANASDTNGSIARVDFYAGALLVGTDTTSPYSVTWSNASAGSYTLTAVARDNLGATTTSAGRSITIGNPTSMPNRAVFNASPDHAIVTRYVLDIFTAGANPATATPMATRDLGRPAVVNGECTVDISAAISGLPGGSYFGTVVAVSSGGTSTPAVSTIFAR